jgi:hypothetical protein
MLSPKYREEEKSTNVDESASMSNDSDNRVNQPPSIDQSRKTTQTNAQWASSTKLRSAWRGVRSFLVQQYRSRTQTFDDTHTSISRVYHPLWQSPVCATFRLIILTLYDAILLLILVSHDYMYRKSIVPSEEFCDSTEVVSYSDLKLPPLDESDMAIGYRVPPMVERCQRYNWNITAAGGFSSTIATILAATHLAAIICRLVEFGHAWVTFAQESRKLKRERKSGKRNSVWHVPPREVYIHHRGTMTSDRTGRLTAISEEEHNIGGEAVRRRRAHKSKSSESIQSKASSGGTRNVEEMLLECLMP